MSDGGTFVPFLVDQRYVYSENAKRTKPRHVARRLLYALDTRQILAFAKTRVVTQHAFAPANQAVVQADSPRKNLMLWEHVSHENGAADEHERASAPRVTSSAESRAPENMARMEQQKWHRRRIKESKEGDIEGEYCCYGDRSFGYHALGRHVGRSCKACRKRASGGGIEDVYEKVGLFPLEKLAALGRRDFNFNQAVCPGQLTHHTSMVSRSG